MITEIYWSVVIFFGALLLGYLVLPKIVKAGIFHIFVQHTTELESDWRDRILKPLTDRMNFVSPNFVTLIGFLLVFLLLFFFSKDASIPVIFWTAILAGFTDMLDGSLARNSKRVTKLGAALDVTRDIFLAFVLSYFLLQKGILTASLFAWFFTGYFFLFIIRMFEFRASGGGFFSAKEDFKFVLDRVRLFLYILGILALILLPVYPSIGTLGEAAIIISIILSWASVLFHSAHLKILKQEKLSSI